MYRTVQNFSPLKYYSPKRIDKFSCFASNTHKIISLMRNQIGINLPQRKGKYDNEQCEKDGGRGEGRDGMECNYPVKNHYNLLKRNFSM